MSIASDHSNVTTSPALSGELCRANELLSVYDDGDIARLERIPGEKAQKRDVSAIAMRFIASAPYSSLRTR